MKWPNVVVIKKTKCQLRSRSDTLCHLLEDFNFFSKGRRSGLIAMILCKKLLNLWAGCQQFKIFYLITVMGLLTARSEYQRFWAKYYGDEARSTSFTKTPKAFHVHKRTTLSNSEDSIEVTITTTYIVEGPISTIVAPCYYITDWHIQLIRKLKSVF